MLDMLNMFVAGAAFSITIVMIIKRFAGLAFLYALACLLNLVLALS